MPWLTTDEASQMLDYNIEYTRRLIRTGRLKAKKHGHIWLVDPKSVEELQKVLNKQSSMGYSKYDPRRGT